MRTALGCFVLTALVIVAAWNWLGAPVPMPNAPLSPGEKLWCVSYAPFRGSQTPLDPTTHISAAQIEDDLTRLAQITDCVRVYSTDFGLDQIAGIAAKHGLKVLQGLWLSSDPIKNRQEIDNAVGIANRYPDTVRAVVVGNEVLLRGEMRGNDLADTIRAVKARVKVPVTYADVWEFWLRNRDVAAAVDFVTIHILPYWEDLPIPAPRAAAHVGAIRQQVVRAFPGKEIVIGEVGWPSAGRLREGALPSPANQARVVQDVLALAKRENFKVNVIEILRRALEADLRRHGRRTLGPARRCVAQLQVQIRRAGVKSSGVGLAGGGRSCIRGAYLRSRLVRWWRTAEAARAVAGHDGQCARRRHSAGMGDRECAARKPGHWTVDPVAVDGDGRLFRVQSWRAPP